MSIWKLMKILLTIRYLLPAKRQIEAAKIMSSVFPLVFTTHHNSSGVHCHDKTLLLIQLYKCLGLIICFLIKACQLQDVSGK